MRKTMIRLSVVVALLSAAPVAAIPVDDDNYGKLAETTSTPFTLVTDVLDAENDWFKEKEPKRLPRVTASKVLADATAKMQPWEECTPAERGAAGEAAEKKGFVAYCWHRERERELPSWMPQGISSTSDAYTKQTADGSPKGPSALAVSWYNDGSPNQGARISFINASSNGKSLSRYAHVLLVEPQITNGQLTFVPVHTHAGGLVWYGTKLFVADSGRGIRVFDTDKIYQIDSGQDKTKVGWDAKKHRYNAFGYKYIMPLQLSYLQRTPGTCGVQNDPDDGKAYENPLCFSWIGLDRGTRTDSGTRRDSLVAGEYRDLADLEASDTRIRVTRWWLNPHNRALCDTDTTCSRESALADEERVTVTKVYMTETPRLQGGLSWKGRFSLSQSLSEKRDDDRYVPKAGSLYTATPGDGNEYDDDVSTFSWTVGAENVTLWRDSTDERLGDKARMWTVTEHDHQRLVLGVFYSAVD